MWCWTIVKIIWTDHVKNEEILHRIKKEINIPHTIKERQAKCTGHFLHRNCLQKHVIVQMTEGMRKKMLSSYWTTLGKRNETGI